MPKPLKMPDPYRVGDSYALEELPFDLEGALILKSIFGSHTYGMAGPDSDIDVRGIFVAPISNAFSLDDEVQVAKSVVGDFTGWSLRKFCRMAVRMDVNAMQILFAPKEAIVEMDAGGQAIMESKDAFVNARVKWSFGGFVFGKVQTAVDRTKTTNADVREKHGYDCKTAMHAVRICRMGAEILERGTMDVRRRDAEELLAIRDGKYESDAFAVFEKRPTAGGSMEDHLVGGMMMKEYSRFLEAAERTTLPANADVERVNRMMQRIGGWKLGIPRERTASLPSDVRTDGR